MSKALAVLALTTSLVAQTPAAPSATQPGPITAVYRERASRRAAFRNEKVQEAIRSGVGWLTTHQDKDGRWDADGFMKHGTSSLNDGPGKIGSDLGVSALALLALLAQADPVHFDSCHLAADWLAGAFDVKSGRVNSELQEFIYDQALATLAMAEAAALLGSARYRDAALSGLSFLETHRVQGAGWRYQPAHKDSDTSVTSWCLAVYMACYHLGLEVRAQSVGEALAWLDSVTDPATGRAGYIDLHGFSSRRAGKHGELFPSHLGEAMTAAALHARLLCGLSPSSDLARAAAKVLVARPPVSEANAIDFYYWLHGSQALAPLQGTLEQRRFESALHKVLLGSLEKDGPNKGSWAPIDVWGEDGGRIYATAANVLALSSPYRMGRTEVQARIPDAPPFRRVFRMWHEEKIGLAAAALAEIPAEAATDESRATKKHVEWHIAVDASHLQRVLATLAQVRRDALDQFELLEAIVARMTPLPVSRDAEARLDAMRKDPGCQQELKLSKELRALQKPYEAAYASNNARQRQQVREQLEKLLEKYPATAAIERIREMIRTMQ